MFVVFSIKMQYVKILHVYNLLLINVVHVNNKTLLHSFMVNVLNINKFLVNKINKLNIMFKIINIVCQIDL